jgi:hypothetical protein
MAAMAPLVLNGEAFLIGPPNFLGFIFCLLRFGRTIFP